MFHVASMARPRRMAKTLRSLLSARSLDVPLSSCQEAVARMYGHASWHALGKAGRSVASPSDEDCAPDEVAARRAVQMDVLGRAGIPAAVAEAVLDELKPTGRGGAGARGRFPRFVLRTTEILEDGGERPLAPQDLTGYIVDLLHSRGFAAVRGEIEEGFLLHYVSTSLDAEARAAANARRLVFEDVAGRWRGFVERTGDPSDPRVAELLRKRWEGMRSAADDLETARTTLGEVAAAVLDPDAGRFEMFCEVENFASYSNEGFVSEIGTAYDGWGEDEFETVRPRPFFDSPERPAWNSAYAAWVDALVPPFVFGTTSFRWKGLDPAEIRRRVAEDERFDPFLVDAMVEEGLAEHHEDAYDQVSKPGLLDEIVAEWSVHAGSGDVVDLAFDDRIRSWNAQQGIVSYRRDPATVVPTDPSTTHAGAVAWCERDVERCRKAYEDADAWEKPDLPPLPERPVRRTGPRMR